MPKEYVSNSMDQRTNNVFDSKTKLNFITILSYNQILMENSIFNIFNANVFIVSYLINDIIQTFHNDSNFCLTSHDKTMFCQCESVILRSVEVP